MNLLWIFIGGGLGSLARYGFSIVSKNVYSGNFPLGTFVSNFLACAVLGTTVYLLHDRYGEEHWLRSLIIVGFCGGFSTFSSFSNETMQLLTTGNWMLATMNILLSVLTGILTIWFLRPV